MKLEKTNQAFSHRIIDGSEFQWDCFPNARYLDYESEYAHGSVIFDTTNQRVYSAEVNDKADKFRYRWIDPEFVQAYRNECEARKVDPCLAWDDIKWNDLEVEDDFLEKANAIFAGREFDSRIVVPLDMTEEEQFQIMKLAHQHDMSLNQFVEHILTNFIEERKRISV